MPPGGRRCRAPAASPPRVYAAGLRIRRQAGVVALTGGLLAAALLVHGALALAAARRQLDGLVDELGGAACDTAAASLRATLLVLDELEEELAESLRLKAGFLADIRADERLLHRFALASGLRHVMVFGEDGTLLGAGEDIPSGDALGLRRARESAARALAQRVGERDLVVREWRVPGAGLRPSLALATRLPQGGVAVLVHETEVFARVRRAAGAGALARRLEAETGIRYVRLDEPAPDLDDVVAFERALDGGRTLRLGLDRSPVRRALAVQRRSLVVSGALVVLVATAAAWGLLRLLRSRAALEERLRRDERVSSLGRLAASIAHEVRNPLNAIGLAVQRIQRRDDASAETKRLAGVVHGEVDRLARTVDEVLRYARPARPRPRRLDAADLVRSVETLARGEAFGKGIAFAAAAPERLAFEGDPDLLRGALWNLVRNAIDVTPPGGRVEVGVRRDGGEIAFVVRDGGPGVELEDRERIFEPFESGSPGGTGLGLSLALSAAQAHGGTIAVDGNEFRLTIPF